MIDLVKTLAPIFLLISSPLHAQAQFVSEQNQQTILSYPSDNGDIDWIGLSDRLELENEAQSFSSYENYVASIVALRIGDLDRSRSFANDALARTSPESERTQIDILICLLNFYQAAPELRSEMVDNYLSTLEMGVAKGGSPDWVTGVSVDVIVDHAYKVDNIEALNRAVLVAEKFAGETNRYHGLVWLANLHMKTAYRLALSPGTKAGNQAFAENAIAANLIFEALDTASTTAERDKLRTLYYRTVTFHAANYSTMLTNNEKVPDLTITIIPEFQSDFQNLCLDRVAPSRKRIRAPRNISKIATGGVLLKLSVKGPKDVTLVEIVDALPGKLAGDYMKRKLERLVKSWKVELNENNDPICKQSGEVLFPFTLSWK